MTINRQHPHAQADQLLAEWRTAVRDIGQREVDGLATSIASMGCTAPHCVSCRIVRGLATLGLLQALCAARDLENDREAIEPPGGP